MMEWQLGTPEAVVWSSGETAAFAPYRPFGSVAALDLRWRMATCGE
jgi:hypothetical protein